MSKPYKQVENEIYEYFNTRFRVGLWTSKTLSDFYDHLTYSQSVEETERLNQAMGSTLVRLPDAADVVADSKLKFSIKKLINDVYADLNTFAEPVTEEIEDMSYNGGPIASSTINPVSIGNTSTNAVIVSNNNGALATKYIDPNDKYIFRVKYNDYTDLNGTAVGFYPLHSADGVHYNYNGRIYYKEDVSDDFIRVGGAFDDRPTPSIPPDPALVPVSSATKDTDELITWERDWNNALAKLHGHSSQWSYEFVDTAKNLGLLPKYYEYNCICVLYYEDSNGKKIK